MAACDNLYGNAEQWQQLFDFLVFNAPENIIYMKEKPARDDEIVRICYIPNIQDFLIEKCPLQWVKDQLEENFEVQRMICGKAHHE